VSEFDGSNQISSTSPQKCCGVSQGFGVLWQFLVEPRDVDKYQPCLLLLYVDFDYIVVHMDNLSGKSRDKRQVTSSTSVQHHYPIS
jgi:hypothetical protein